MASSTILLATERSGRLEGKVALITGGANGIGESTARLLCRHGARIIVADIHDDKGDALCRGIGGPSVATYVHCDVTDESNVRDAVDAAVGCYGKLDIVCNNAGTFGWPIANIVETKKEDFERVVALNLTGMFLVTKHAARVMIPARRGSIVITASTASVLGGNAPYAYTCSKHAVVGLCKAAAAELGQYGVRVNCVSPYLLETELARKALGLEAEGAVEEKAEARANLKGVRLRAEDVAEAVLYLASDEAKYVSGHNLLVDGGSTTTNRLLS